MADDVPYSEMIEEVVKCGIDVGRNEQHALLLNPRDDVQGELRDVQDMRLCPTLAYNAVRHEGDERCFGVEQPVNHVSTPETWRRDVELRLGAFANAIDARGLRRCQ